MLYFFLIIAEMIADTVSLIAQLTLQQSCTTSIKKQKQPGSASSWHLTAIFLSDYFLLDMMGQQSAAEIMQELFLAEG